VRKYKIKIAKLDTSVALKVEPTATKSRKKTPKESDDNLTTKRVTLSTKQVGEIKEESVIKPVIRHSSPTTTKQGDKEVRNKVVMTSEVKVIKTELVLKQLPKGLIDHNEPDGPLFNDGDVEFS
jgi:hypothetical protein